MRTSIGLLLALAFLLAGRTAALAQSRDALDQLVLVEGELVTRLAILPRRVVALRRCGQRDEEWARLAMRGIRSLILGQVEQQDLSDAAMTNRTAFLWGAAAMAEFIATHEEMPPRLCASLPSLPIVRDLDDLVRRARVPGAIAPR